MNIRHVLITVVCGIFFGTLYVCFGHNNPPKLLITPLIGNFYVFTTYNPAGDFSANGMYAVTSEGVVMIDMPWDTTQTVPLLDSISRRHSAKVIMSISTHFHNDRTGGIDILRSRGVQTFCSAQTLKLAQERHEHLAEYTFTSDTTFIIGGVKFAVFFPGAGHTTDNIVVWFPAEKILYGGCFVKSAEAQDLGYTADADVRSWPVAMRNVIQRYPNPSFVIPGHGNWLNTRALQHTLKLLRKAQSND